VFVYWLLRSYPNPINFNRNSASLAVIEKLAKELKAKDVSFVMVDQCVNSYQGLKLLQSILPVNKAVILLDALAAGEKLVIVHREDTDVAKFLQAGSLEFFNKSYDEEQANKNQLHFLNHGVVIASGSIKKQQFVVKNTRSKNDTNLDLERLQKLTDLLLKTV